MITTEQWRASIGCYTHGTTKNKWSPSTIVVPGTIVSLSIRVVLFSLLVMSGNVERNPGPTFTAAKDELLTSVAEKVKLLEDYIAKLESTLQNTIEQNTLLSKACLHLEQKCESLESQSRRENVIIHNLPVKEGGGESWQETEQKARKHFQDMGVEGDIQIERAHRLNTRKPDSPVIVKLSCYKTKEKIMEKSKQLKRERRQKNIQTDENEPFVNEDYTARVRKARALLRPGLMDAIRDNKRAFLSYDKLVIEGKPYWFDDTKKSLTDKKPDVMCCSELNDKFKELK